ncbi:Fic family protein [Methanogenium marinum]|uniref:Fic family protein n=1 Tax=Methanogenium marinum TaxID=348610 RepID=A0A9Q4KT62_9EURY|nr:Fic family protein [Methanogenium marinum]MDE4907748.1 Fic family protein [Methanogenium marinum]
MYSLTVQKIIEIQSWLILQSVQQEDHGMAGLILTPGTLENLVYYGNNLQNPHERAAWMLHGIATRHPFYQGNKRTALAVAEMILILSPENMIITAEDDAIYLFVMGIARYSYSIEDVQDWLIQNSGNLDD